MIREWHPATAPDLELCGWLDVYNTSLAKDLPEDPPWRLDGLREWFTVEPPGETLLHLVAEEAGEIAGFAWVRLPGHENRHVADVSIVVLPDRRRRGHGGALLDAVVDRLGRGGRRTIMGEATEGTDGVPFAEARGLQCALRDRRSLLTLADVDPVRIASLAGAPHPGYEIHCWRDELPEEMLAPYAAAKRAMNDAPRGELDEAPFEYDSDRIRGRVATQRARGNRTYRLVAVDQETGAVAGLTELVWIRVCPPRADQGDTCVVPAHRGRGLGLWMKAAMLQHIRATEPDLVDIQTWNAESNEHMLAVNRVLGFRRDRMWRDYQAPVADVRGRTGAGGAPMG